MGQRGLINWVRFTSVIIVLSNVGFALGQTNSQPTIDNVPNQNILEDAGPQNITLTGISDGDGFTQTLTISYTSSNHAIITPQAVIYTQGQTTATLPYEASQDANGTVQIVVTVMDDGGSGGGSIDTKQIFFDITVTPVNDKPTFTRGADQPILPAVLLEDAGPQTVNSWATDVNTGGTIGNENFQSLIFNLTIVETTGNISFSDLSLTPSGTLLFTTDDDTNGEAKVRIELEDNGGSTPPDENLSDADTLIITVTSVNDPPVFVGGSDVTILEGAGAQTLTAWATSMSPSGGSDETGQSLTFELTEISKSNFLTFLTPPAIDPITGDLTFEADPQANGSASYELVLVDDGSATSPSNNRSGIQTFIINVTAINDPPTATLPSLYDSFEDAGEVSIANFATDLDAGSDDEETLQSLDFDVQVVSTTGTLVFDSPPTINSIGTLEFIASENTNGTAQLLVSLFDNGSNEAPNTNVGPTFDLTINVEAVNDPPSFSKGEDPAILEDNGPITFTQWASNISAGPPDEASQVISFQITQIFIEGTLAFLSGPTINSSGDLSFETDAHTNGTAAFEIIAVDDGSSEGLNINTSAFVGLGITVDAVNDGPTFTIGPDITVDEGAGLQTISPWATDLTPGGGTDEVDQTYFFEVEILEITGNLVMAQGPIISSTGELSFQTAPNTFGTAEFLVSLIDDGLSDPPNVNTSDTQNFTLTVNEVNDAPTDISLSPTNIQENLPVGTLVGNFTAIDPDDTEHSFEFASGIGDEDNTSFQIQGNSLLSSEVFDLETKPIYTIRVSASDGFGVVEKVFLIEILLEPVTGVMFPNAFTPNGDGENDTWLIEDIEFFPRAVVSIYNSSGQRVYNSVGYSNPWDGTYEGDDLPVATYFVVIDLDGELDTVQGTVTILR